jgi:predicted transcriptional regulator of viral defense system
LPYIGHVSTAEKGESKKKGSAKPKNGRRKREKGPESPFVTALRQFADVQGGYILAGQAEEIGVSRQLMAFYIRPEGPLTRYVRGLYRMKDYPESPYERAIAEWYDTGIRIEGVLSHITAADILGLTDSVSWEVHMTAPVRYRLRRPPKGHVFHFVEDPVPEEERFLHEGVPVTKAERTILDLLETEDASERVAEIIQRALRKRKTSMMKLREAAKERLEDVQEALEEAYEMGKGK